MVALRLFEYLNFQKCSDNCQRPKLLRERCVFTLLTWKCALHHNAVHFINISTSKSAPNMVCLVRLNFEMCFAPQGRDLFFTSQIPKALRAWGVMTFWVRNVRRASTACNLSSLISPQGSAPAALVSPLFDPPEPQNIGQRQCFATLLLFMRLYLLSCSFLFSDLLSSAFLFSDSSHFHFSICPYCRKFGFFLR